VVLPINDKIQSIFMNKSNGNDKIRVVLYTGYFPFTKMSEAFLETEIKYIDAEQYDLTIVPVNNSTYCRDVSPLVKIDYNLCNCSRLYKLKAFIQCFSLDTLRQVSIFHIKKSFKYLYASNLVYKDLEKRANGAKHIVFYSYWLSYVPISFARYKHTHKYTEHVFISRGHGTDIYTKDAGFYYPAREFVMNGLDMAFVISDYGALYLLNKYPSIKGRVLVSRLGVEDNKCEHSNSNHIIRFVSCSSVIPLKRVSLIFSSIASYAKSHPTSAFEWIHFGDGPLIGELRNKIKDSQQNNLRVVLKGEAANSSILQFYKNNKMNIFILLSVSEGIPVSIMEAISSCIPVLATNVGGIKEIVNKETGMLLNRDFVQEEFDEAVNYLLDNNERISETAYDFFKKNYCAENNYKAFYQHIRKLYIKNL